MTYKVDSAAGGYLTLGKLTARLEKKAETQNLPSPAGTDLKGWSGRGAGVEGSSQPNTDGNANQPQSALTLTLSRKRARGPDSSPRPLAPNPSLSPDPCPLFAVRTPIAIVTDLGTEFGVIVDQNGHVDTRVFAGKVKVERRPHVGAPFAEVLLAGQAAHLDRNTAAIEAHADRTPQQQQFIRQLPRPATRDAIQGSFSDAFAGKVSPHWLNPAAATCRNNDVEFADRAYLRTSGDFDYGAHDFVATVKMTNADNGAVPHVANGAAFFGLGDGTISGFYEEPCADQFPSVYLMYAGAGWIDAVAAVHTTEPSKQSPGFRKHRGIPGAKAQPGGTTITARLAWTAATNTAVFSVDADGDGVFEGVLRATYPGLSSSGYTSRLFIGGARGVRFSDFHVVVGPHAEAAPDVDWDDERASSQKQP